MTASPQKTRSRTLVGGAAVVALVSGLGSATLVQLTQAPPSTVERLSVPSGASGPTVTRCWSVPLGWEVRPPVVVEPPPLVRESFDDANLAARGWYDNVALDVQGGGLRYRFQPGASLPDSGNGTRIQFSPQNALRLNYRIKLAPGFAGSGESFGPHLAYLLTTADGRYAGLARSHLTVYSEFTGGTPIVRLQDGLNLSDPAGPVAGCGSLIGSVGSEVSCYGTGATRNNVRSWTAPVAPLTVGVWHEIALELRLNSVGQANGVIRLSVDGTRMIVALDVVFRTADHPMLQFNQLVLGPYFTRSPVDQQLYIDDVVLLALP